MVLVVSIIQELPSEFHDIRVAIATSLQEGDTTSKDLVVLQIFSGESLLHECLCPFPFTLFYFALSHPSKF